MYLWKVDLLVEDFKNNKVNQIEQFKYMMLFSIVMILVTDPSVYISASYNLFDFINTLFASLLTVWGVYYCYKINAKGDNTDFIVRVMCLGLPVGIRVAVIFFSISFLTAIIEGFVGIDILFDTTESGEYITNPTDVALSSFFLITYYLYLSRKLQNVSSSNT